MLRAVTPIDGGFQGGFRGFTMCFTFDCVAAFLFRCFPSIPPVICLWLSIHLCSTHCVQCCVDEVPGGQRWLDCHGDLLAAEEIAGPSFAALMAPILQFVKWLEFKLRLHLNPLSPIPAKTGRALRMFCVENTLSPTSPTKCFLVF